MNHFHLAIVADDRVQIEIVRVLIEDWANAVVRSLFFCVADRENGIWFLVWKVEVPSEFLWSIQLSFSLDRLLLIYSEETGFIHHLALLMQELGCISQMVGVVKPALVILVQNWFSYEQRARVILVVLLKHPDWIVDAPPSPDHKPLNHTYRALEEVCVHDLPQLVQLVAVHRGLNARNRVIQIHPVGCADSSRKLRTKRTTHLESFEAHVIGLIVPDTDHEVFRVCRDDSKTGEDITPLILPVWIKDTQHLSIHTRKESVVVRTNEVCEEWVAPGCPS